MAREKLLGVELGEFLERHDLTHKDFDKTKLKAEDLNAIAKDHETKKYQLTQAANYVSNMLQQVPEVHSTKSRLKTPDGLVAKVIRKKLDSPERVIDLANYEIEITDLIGVRALHLFKGQWKPISDYARTLGKEIEQPVAYYRSGDSEEIVQGFRDAGLRPEVRVVGYRSVHHVISCAMGVKIHPVEIQIRTVFEEAWAEIDHIVRYPRKTDNPELAGFLKLFNSFAGTADDMGTYLMTLREWLNKHKDSADRERKRADRLEQQIAQLKISELDRKNLQAQVAELRKAASVATPPVFVSTSASAFSMGTDMAPYMTAIAGASGFNSVYGTESVKSCPNGHIFKVPSSFYAVGGHQCPMCTARVP
jgi:putative GTP pyrophosphokinase